VTYTKTYAKYDAWAQTMPWTCLIEDTGCVSSSHNHSPMANDPCAIESCAKPLLPDEVCYAVTQLERDADGREPWVCWRHIRPDEGPVRATASSTPAEETP
jgi:hypothetical protein